MFHHAKRAARLRILVGGRHPFPAHTLSPPVASVAHLIAVTVVYGNLMDATQMENEKRFEDWSRIDALDADGVAQLNAKAKFFEGYAFKKLAVPHLRAIHIKLYLVREKTCGKKVLPRLHEVVAVNVTIGSKIYRPVVR